MGSFEGFGRGLVASTAQSISSEVSGSRLVTCNTDWIWHDSSEPVSCIYISLKTPTFVHILGILVPSKCKDEFLLSHWGVDISMIDSLLIKLDAQFSKSPTNLRYIKITWWNLMNFAFWCVEQTATNPCSDWNDFQVVNDSIRVAAHAAIPVLSFAAAPEVGGSLDFGFEKGGICKGSIRNQLFWTLVSSICEMCDLEDICDCSSKLKLWRCFASRWSVWRRMKSSWPVRMPCWDSSSSVWLLSKTRLQLQNATPCSEFDYSEMTILYVNLSTCLEPLPSLWGSTRVDICLHDSGYRGLRSKATRITWWSGSNELSFMRFVVSDSCLNLAIYLSKIPRIWLVVLGGGCGVSPVGRPWSTSCWVATH